MDDLKAKLTKTESRLVVTRLGVGNKREIRGDKLRSSRCVSPGDLIRSGELRGNNTVL